MSGQEGSSAFDASKGSIGKQFTEGGAIGGTAQKAGGPFDKQGAIGKEFTSGGSVGGSAQSVADTDQGAKPSAFDAQGIIGSKFSGDGSIGSLGNKVGGPLASDGAIGKQFEAGGGIGGTVQNMLGDKKSS